MSSSIIPKPWFMDYILKIIQGTQKGFSTGNCSFLNLPYQDDYKKARNEGKLMATA